jgi:hypothetical protein
VVAKLVRSGSDVEQSDDPRQDNNTRLASFFGSNNDNSSSAGESDDDDDDADVKREEDETVPGLDIIATMPLDTVRSGILGKFQLPAESNKT